MANNILQDTIVRGNLDFASDATVTNFPAAGLTNATIASNADIARSKLAQDTFANFEVMFTDLRVWNALTSLLPSAAAADDLGLVNGTFASDAPTVTAGDCKAGSSVTRYARFLVALPAEYDDDESIRIRIRAAMETTVADVSTTLDLSVYSWDKDGSLDGSPTDLCTTAGQDMNSLTAANYDFTITDGGLVSGDVLDCRISIQCDDSATGTAVTPAIYSIALQCDIRG